MVTLFKKKPGVAASSSGNDSVTKKPASRSRNGDEEDGNALRDRGDKRAGPRTQTLTTIPGAPIRTRDIEDNTEAMKQSPAYSDEVMLRLVNLIYDPLATMLFQQAGIMADEAHLLSLTRINSSREAAFWAQQIAKEAAYNKYIKHYPCEWPISQVWRIAFLLARRSIPGTCGPGFMLGVGLAQEQSITKSEEAGEEGDWS